MAEKENQNENPRREKGEKEFTVTIDSRFFPLYRAFHQTVSQNGFNTFIFGGDVLRITDILPIAAIINDGVAKMAGKAIFASEAEQQKMAVIGASVREVKDKMAEILKILDELNYAPRTRNLREQMDRALGKNKNNAGTSEKENTEKKEENVDKEAPKAASTTKKSA